METILLFLIIVAIIRVKIKKNAKNRKHGFTHSAKLEKVSSQKQPDFDILNFILLFLIESHTFRIEWTLNHMHTTFGNRDSEFSHFLQELDKNGQILIF